MDIWGAIKLDGARRVVEIERQYDVPVSELWDAVTNPERLARWIGDVSITGKSYVLTFSQYGSAPQTTGRITECEEGSHLRLTWKHEGERETDVDVVFRETPNGSALRLVHSQLPALEAADYGAGWQEHFALLAKEIGKPVQSASFHELLPAYRAAEAALVPALFDRESDGWSVSLVRLLDAEPSQVWSAMTEPDRIGRWLWPVVTRPDDPERKRPLKLADRFTLGDENMPDGVQPFSVLEIEPERRLVLSWGDGGPQLSFEVTPYDDGTMLSLRQSATPDVEAAGRLRSGPDFAAGWHSLVDTLAVMLQGGEVSEPEALWEAAYSNYR